jgi:hypothetical protein
MQRKLQISLLGLSVVGIGLGYVLFHAYRFGICGVTLFCANLMDKGNALFYGMQGLAVIFALLLLVPTAFQAWKKFAIWYIPFMFIYFAMYKNEGFFSIPEKDIYAFFTGVYVLISVVIIAISALIKRQKKAA